MKSNFKRLVGMLLAILMIVAMLPTTAFTDDASTVPAGASFVIGGQKYYLTDVTVVGTGGKTY